MPELSIFSKNLEPIAKNRLLELLSSLKIDDPNWIDENLWKKYRDAILIVPAVTWPKLIDYFQNEKSRNTGEPLQVQKEVIAAMEQNLDNQWFRDFSGLELTSNTVVLKAKVTASQTTNN
ncbi:uncharacterized protein LOC123472612 [Daphnia magna]|uniref:Uncharacterized protein n=1 Tax=Daphnia magna TaxID=35525 RepID=A0ABR0BB03_9CRUS|nr:uncharacterized protein LOC123472612 [Daphnia magna]KAK4045715.1 hypothetical protein OUZ56_033587 [Daphnia magna]